jgi:HSP90 family molecular chaperone
VVIGHFGLGFYSAFMVAKKVEIFSFLFNWEKLKIKLYIVIR